MRLRRLAATWLLFVVFLGFQAQLRGDAGAMVISGQVTDSQARPVPSLAVQLQPAAGKSQRQTTDTDGRFAFRVEAAGRYTVKTVAPGFREASRTLLVGAPGPAEADIRLDKLAVRQESITVTSDAQSNVLFPDPGQRVYVRQELLGANPGRPGAPISIPGVPVETASGGIKAPQYFSPGVAGDHGEPIAEYIQVGTYLVSNNLSSNAHGNGYADPNFLVPEILDGVQTDGGAFNVREGNHAESLSATYQLRSRLEPLVTITGDYRDVDVTAGWSPGHPGNRLWVAIEAAYGNGFLDRLEHRQQYKLNGFREIDLGSHDLTLFGVGYYGSSTYRDLCP